MEYNYKCICLHSSHSAPYSNMRMVGAELVMAKAKETRETPKRSRPSRKTLQAFQWRFEADYEDAKGSHIQTHETLS